MPWNETNAMEQRIQFIRDWLNRTHTVSDLCALYGISRKSACKWIDRYQHEGPDSVLGRSHAAKVVHNKTAPEVEQALMQMRALHPTPGLVMGFAAFNETQHDLRVLRARPKVNARHTRTRRPDVDRQLRRGLDELRRPTGIAEVEGERHREAACVCGGDQLLRVRSHFVPSVAATSRRRRPSAARRATACSAVPQRERHAHRHWRAGATQWRTCCTQALAMSAGPLGWPMLWLMGWLMGLEPTTTRITIWDSTN